MHVLATAGHVDHGKSTLVRALTGIEPDRWAEERRRGMTLDLGFAWTDVDGATLAFVDVPGHERFVPTMLAGVGPVPAALLVVAADEGWMPQTQEHVDALDALGMAHTVVAVTRADLADPGPVLADTAERLARTTLEAVACVAVCAPSGTGLADLRRALTRLVGGLPEVDPGVPARLWIDRAFSVRGAGTVVTGTLPAGTISAHDELELAGRRVRVRGLQSLGRPVERASGTARVAVNMRDVEPGDITRGDALVAPRAFPPTDTVDVLVRCRETPATRLILHVGSAAVPVHVRPLGAGVARLRLARPLPLALGDRGLLRDPGRHRIVAGLTVADTAPPALARRGSAAARGRELTDPAAARAARARRDERLRTDVIRQVAAHATRRPLEPGPTVASLVRALGLSSEADLAPLLDHPLVLRGGRVVDASRPALPAPVVAAVQTLLDDLAGSPFAAPDAERLAELRLGPRELAAAERAGALLRVTDGVVLAPGAPAAAADVLARLPQPFTVSEAKTALGTTRRVAIPLLELLDRRGVTARTSPDRRIVAPEPSR